jgi:hypothetical protein
MGKHEGKRPRARPRDRWNDIIKLGLKIIWEDVGVIYSAQDKDSWRTSVNMVINLRGTIKSGECLD